MGNVLRVLGIVVASMVLGLVALFLALFTICGGMKSSDSAGVLAVCLVLMGGAVTAIVLLGRGIAAARPTAQGLAVSPAMPAGVAPATPMAVPVTPSAPAPVLAPALGRTDVQVLMGLRIALVVYVLTSLGSMAINAANFTRFGSAVAFQLIARNLLALVPPLAILVAVSIRTPPARAALDAAAGMGIAALLFRFGMLGVSGVLTAAFARAEGVSLMLLWMAIFSLLDAAIAGLALHLRSRLGAFSAPSLIVAVLAFLLWDGLVQAVMQFLFSLVY